MLKLSQRIQSVAPSRTVRFTTLIAELRKEGRNIINFAVGEPEYPTPEPIIKATQKALERGETRYSAIGGLSELCEGIAEKFEGCTADNILVTNGSKQALFAIFQVICNPGDEVIIPSPYWVSFSEQVRLAGAEPVLVATRQNQLDLDAISSALTDRTSAILINSPNNPTGAVYSRSDLEAVANLALKHDLYIVADEAYDVFVFGEPGFISLYEFEDIRDRLIITRSFSKNFSMTGFRVGYIAAAAEMISPLKKLHSHVTGNVCTFAQHGAIAALSLSPDIVEGWLADLEQKKNMAFECISALFDCVYPQGAFYLFPDVSKRMKPGETAEAFAADLLEQTGVAVVPSEAFGMDNHVRISYGVSKSLLAEGLEKVETFIKKRKTDK